MFARYFLRNAINNGFPILVCDGVSEVVKTGSELVVDLPSSLIRNLATGQELTATPLSKTALEILRVGGLVPYAKQKLAERGGLRHSSAA